MHLVDQVSSLFVRYEKTLRSQEQPSSLRDFSLLIALLCRKMTFEGHETRISRGRTLDPEVGAMPCRSGPWIWNLECYRCAYLVAYHAGKMIWSSES
jgi:hypothetical protein